MRVRVLLGLILCLALVAPAVALAQSSGAADPQQAQAQNPSASATQAQVNQHKDRSDKDKNRDYLMVYVGRNFGGDMFKNFTASDRGAPRTYGVALGFWGKGALSGEFDFGYHPQFFGKASAPSPWGLTGNTVGNNNLMTFTASFVIHPVSIDPGTVRIRPYVLVGGGLARATISDFAKFFNSDKRNVGVVDAGGGLQIYPIHQFGIRADVRYFKGVGANKSSDSITNGWGWLNTWNWWRVTVGAGFAF